MHVLPRFLLRFLRHYLLALQFFTRIPVTGRLAAWVGYSPAMLRASAGHFPGVGWVVGAVSAAVLALALHRWGAQPFGPLAAALLATIASVWLTGGFHEDGLADTCDGLGGASTRARALLIMKDSRLGSYGALALVLALGLKAALLALLGAPGALGLWPAAALLLAAHVLSRFAPLLLMRALPYVGDESAQGSGEAAGAGAGDTLPHAVAAGGGAASSPLGDAPAFASKSKPLADAVTWGGVTAGVLWALPALVLLGAVLGPGPAAAALALGGGALAFMARWLHRRLQGFTGDTLGATQQVCELALYLGVALAVAG